VSPSLRDRQSYAGEASIRHEFEVGGSIPSGGAVGNLWKYGAVLLSLVLLLRLGVARRAWYVLRALMNRSAVLLVLGAVLVIPVGVSRGTTFALTSSSNTAHSSCIAAWSVTGTWSNGETRNFKAKCYYDPALNQPADQTAWFDGTPSPSGLYFGWKSSGGSFDSAAPSGTSGFVWSNYALTVASDSLGYVEFTIDVKRWSGISKTQSGVSGTMEFFFDTTAATPYDRGMIGNDSHSDLVAWASYDSTDPYYYYGSGPYSPIVAFCGAVIDWTSHDMAERIYEGDELGFDWEITAGLTGNVDVQFEPPLALIAPGGGPWFNIVNEAVIGTSGSGTIEVQDQGWLAEGGQEMHNLSMRCWDEVAEVYRYKVAGDDSNTVNDGYLRPCMQSRVTWPSMQTVEAGDEQSWYISHTVTGFSGAAAEIEVEYTTWDDGNGDAPPSAFAGLTWTSVNVFSAGEFGNYDLTAGFDGTSRQFLLRCTDDTGVYYGAPWSSAARLPNSGSGDASEEGCYSQTGIGLRPSSWVPGLVRMTTCTLRVLFVPDMEAVSESWDGLMESASENAPLAWAYGAHGVVTDAADGMESAIAANDEGCFTVVPDGGDLIDSAAGQACPSTMELGTFSTVRPYLGIAVWIYWAWIMYGALFSGKPGRLEAPGYEQGVLF